MRGSDINHTKELTKELVVTKKQLEYYHLEIDNMKKTYDIFKPDLQIPIKNSSPDPKN
jgi:hypothetical protein